MKPFLDDDFLLENKTSERLYHEFAAGMPIIDYHNHLPPEHIAYDSCFNNLTQAWLADDHYKWRAMRANGVPEKYCTGNIPDEEKFSAMGGNGTLYPAQPALPLDAPRTEKVFRH